MLESRASLWKQHSSVNGAFSVAVHTDASVRARVCVPVCTHARGVSASPSPSWACGGSSHQLVVQIEAPREPAGPGLVREALRFRCCSGYSRCCGPACVSRGGLSRLVMSPSLSRAPQLAALAPKCVCVHLGMCVCCHAHVLVYWFFPSGGRLGFSFE